MAGARRVRRIAYAAACAVLLVACSGDDADSATDTAAEISVDVSPSGPAVDTSEALGTTAAPSVRLDDAALPGDAVDLFPYEGAALTVVGVEADDALNVRVGPGPEYDVVTTLTPTSSGDAVATGRNRQVDSGVWAEVTVGDMIGWSNTAYLLQTAGVDDDTANLYTTPQDHPIDESVEALGLEVAAEYASIDPTSRMVVVDGPHPGDPATVTVDVLGLGDDAVGGYRVVVTASPVSGGYRVVRVEAITLCSRGVDGSLCL